MRVLLGILTLALALVACGSRRGTRSRTDGAIMLLDGGSVGLDAGSARRDSGAPNADAGFPTSCDATDVNAISTVGCNGGILGAAVPANAFGGLCVPGTGDDVRGSCSASNGVCGVDMGTSGICVQTCTPSSADYVSRGDCPSGGRCFNLGEAALCFTDCNSGTDCTSGGCDSEGSCLPPP